MKVISSKQFYELFGKEGLEKRSSLAVSEDELIFLKDMFKKEGRVLDLACGYGRVAIPLMKEGYNIEGVDISPSLIGEISEEFKKRFRIGDMRELDYSDNEFDFVICIWSSFSEIVNKGEQLKVIKEVLRVLKVGGVAFFDLSLWIENILSDKSKGDFFEFAEGTELLIGKLGGINGRVYYNHSEDSIRSLLIKCGVEKFELCEVEFGNKRRLSVKFWKNGNN